MIDSQAQYHWYQFCPFFLSSTDCTSWLPISTILNGFWPRAENLGCGDSEWSFEAVSFLSFFFFFFFLYVFCGNDKSHTRKVNLGWFQWISVYILLTHTHTHTHTQSRSMSNFVTPYPQMTYDQAAYQHSSSSGEFAQWVTFFFFFLFFLSPRVIKCNKKQIQTTRKEVEGAQR